jgi:hypothetical protein
MTKAALAAYEVELKRQGFVIVPREPTEAMLKAGATVDYVGGEPLAAMYRAMIAAATNPDPATA